MIIVIILALVILIGGSFYFYHVAIASTPKDFLSKTPDFEKSDIAKKMKAFEENPKDWLQKQELEIIKITSDDGLTLNGYFLEASVPTKKSIIIAHGYSGQAKDMGRYARFYYEKLGYHVLLPDARGHGKSDGDYIGFGWHERKDYVQWINVVIKKVGKDSSIVLHGVSMGGATVLMTSGERLPTQVKAVVADCGYTSAEEVLKYQLKRMYHLPSFPILQITSLLTKVRAGFSFKEASALEQVKKAKVPILYIHGKEDLFVPTDMAYKLYEKTNSEKELLLVPKATHCESYIVNKEAYESKLKEFFNKYVKTGR